MKKLNPIFENIAKKQDIETLQPRGMDALDFYELSVWQIAEMLQQAYLAGAVEQAGGISELFSNMVCDNSATVKGGK